MALREFVANAIDRTIRQESNFLPALNDKRLSVEMTPDAPRAKDGYTRVYVAVNNDVQRFYGELPRRFLHFSEKPEQVFQSLLPKASRNLTGQSAVIYRDGVYVREVDECKDPSIWDYNFKASELTIDESRNSNEYQVKAGAAVLIANATQAELEFTFERLLEQRPLFEDVLDSWYMAPSWSEPNLEQR